MNRAVLTVLGLMALSVPVSAADMVVSSPDWTGPYAGLAAGISDHVWNYEEMPQLSN